jgi:trk system potassium uptake protein TrkA
MLTLYAADVSDAKVITQIQRKTFHNVISRLQLGSIIYPRELTAEAIVAYVRGMAASRDNDNIETMYHMFDNRVEAVEFSVRAESRATEEMLMNLKLRDNTLVACIIRDGQSRIPRGQDVIRVGDNVIIVSTHMGLHVLDDILK